MDTSHICEEIGHASKQAAETAGVKFRNNWIKQVWSNYQKFFLLCLASCRPQTTKSDFFCNNQKFIENVYRKNNCLQR